MMPAVFFWKIQAALAALMVLPICGDIARAEWGWLLFDIVLLAGNALFARRNYQISRDRRP